MPRAQSVVDVILGEARAGDEADMRAVASAMVNRANALGVPLESVVSVPSEFNAYGRSLPAGVNAYRNLAEQALNDVLANGPTHTGTFYATPNAAGNLPRGLREVTSTAGHRYFEDPQNRSIMTADGYRTPSLTAFAPTQQAQNPFDALLNPPTPTPAPSYSVTPTAKPEIQFSNAAAQPVQRQALADLPSMPDYNRPDTPFSRAVSPSPVRDSAASFDWGRMADPTVQSAVASFDPGRFGPSPTAQAKASRPGVSFDTPVDGWRFGDDWNTAVGMKATPSPIGYTPEELLTMDVEMANPDIAYKNQLAQYNAGKAPQMAQAARANTIAAGTAPTAPQATPGYVDPTVRSAYAASPTQVRSPGVAAIDNVTVGSTAPMSGLSQAMAQSKAANDRLSDRQSSRMRSAALGGLLGTAVAGPLGTLVGIGLGNKYANRDALPTDYYPDATTFGGRLAQLIGYDPGNGGYDALTTDSLASVADRFGVSLSDADRAALGNSTGRDVYNESGQFRDAVNSGRAGLW